MRVECDVDAPGILILVEDLFPIFAAIYCAENPALCVRPIRVAQRSHKNDVRIVRIDDDFADGATVVQADVLPGLACVQRFVDAISLRDIAAQAGLAGTNVNRIVVRISHRQASNISRSLFVEYWRPGHGPIGGFPHSAARRTEIISRRIAGNSGCGQRASTAERTDEPILHSLEWLVFWLGRLVFGSGPRVRRCVGSRRRRGVGLNCFRLTFRFGLGKSCALRPKS